MRYARVSTPCGDLVLGGRDRLESVSFDPHRGADPVGAGWLHDAHAFGDAQDQLAAWFAGTSTSFDLDLAPVGTAFQRRVWAALQQIPFGSVRTYADVAAELGTAPRAVGAANGANPFAVIVPCHRLVGRAGLTGYAGGLERKRWLLDFEAQTSSRRPTPASRSTRP